MPGILNKSARKATGNWSRNIREQELLQQAVFSEKNGMALLMAGSHLPAT
jgi:hypothetical protein